MLFRIQDAKHDLLMISFTNQDLFAMNVKNFVPDNSSISTNFLILFKQSMCAIEKLIIYCYTCKDKNTINLVNSVF